MAACVDKLIAAYGPKGAGERPSVTEGTRSSRRGWTLMELLAAMAIFTILSGAIFVSSRAVRNSRLGATAKQQLALVATAIDQYASFWPKWVEGATVTADRGWPHFIPGSLFHIPPFDPVANFNNTRDFALVHDTAQPNIALRDNETLAYALTASSGKGPSLKDRDGANFQDIRKVDATEADPLYPTIPPSTAAGAREVMVDPWGTPLRYFWVWRDPTSYRGWSAVLTDDPINVANFRRAEGFVLESAGPNKMFGNLWKVNPSPAEIKDAADNQTVSP